MRWRLVEATLDALMEHEYNNTSTTEIVRLAGVSRSALDHHFSCKAELIAAASEQMLTEATREIEELASKLISTLRGMGVQTILRLETEYYDQMLAFARGLMPGPYLLLLDEPSAALSPVIAQTIFDKIIDINKTGKAIMTALYLGGAKRKR